MEKKNLLIFAHYYYPDVASTGQLLKELAEGMLKEFAVTVICTVPSYTGNIEDRYKKQPFHHEDCNGVKIIRVRVPEFTKTSKKSRIKNINAYFFGAWKACKQSGKQDYIFALSQPPVLGGLLGVLGKWQKKAKLIYCIQDFNPEQITAVGYFNNKIALKAMMTADKFSCRHSNLVITVGKDLVETLKKRFHHKKIPAHTMINNWTDEKEIYPLSPTHEKVMTFRKKYALENKFVIMYSGNIGLYYDFEGLIRVIKRFKKGYTTKGIYEQGMKTSDGREVVFAFVGDGAVLKKLVAYTEKHRFENVVFIPYQDKKDLLYTLNVGDVHWCVNAKGIKGVSCPSKAYGIMAAGRPILGVLEKDTEIRCLIEESHCGKCCDPEDYNKIATLIQWYIEHADTQEFKQMGQSGRKYLENHLTKDISIGKYIQALRKL